MRGAIRRNPDIILMRTLSLWVYAPLKVTLSCCFWILPDSAHHNILENPRSQQLYTYLRMWSEPIFIIVKWIFMNVIMSWWMITTFKKERVTSVCEGLKIFSQTSHEYLFYLSLTNLYDKKLINNSKVFTCTSVPRLLKDTKCLHKMRVTKLKL